MRSHRASQRQLPETLLGNYRRQYRTVLCMGKHRLAHDSDRYARIPFHLPAQHRQNAEMVCIGKCSVPLPYGFTLSRLLQSFASADILAPARYHHHHRHVLPVFQRTPHSALFLKRNWGTHRRNRHPATCMHLPDIHPVASCFFYLPACFPTSLQTHQPEHVLFFSTLYLFRENPFSDHIQMLPPDGQKEASLQTSPLFASINTYLKECPAYTDKGYTLKALAGALDKKERQISQAIKSEGFTGFREYINYLRLEHFKQLATEDPNKNIKELMYLCGFTSRTTFYRNFAEKFGISPTQFIENLQKNAGIIEEYD